MRTLIFGSGRPELTTVATRWLKKRLEEQSWVVVSSFERNAKQWRELPSKPVVLTPTEAKTKNYPATQPLIIDQVVSNAFYQTAWVKDVLEHGQHVVLVDGRPEQHVSKEVLHSFKTVVCGKTVPNNRNTAHQVFQAFASEQKTVTFEDWFKTLCGLDVLGQMSLLPLSSFPYEPPKEESMPQPPKIQIENHHGPLLRNQVDVWVSLQVKHGKPTAKVLEPFKELRHLSSLIGCAESAKARHDTVSPNAMQIHFRFDRASHLTAIMVLVSILERLKEQELLDQGSVTL